MGTLTDVSALIAGLPQLHANLWAVFRPVANKKDTEQLERYLELEDIRDRFYVALREFAKGLQVALGAATFYDVVPEAQIATYKRDLAFFHNLRSSVQQRYAETIQYAAYEQKIRKLMDRRPSPLRRRTGVKANPKAPEPTRGQEHGHGQQDGHGQRGACEPAG